MNEGVVKKKLQLEIVHEVDRLSEELASVAKFIGTHPELAYHEYQAQERLIAYLKKHGFKIKKGIGGIKTAFLATAGQGNVPAGRGHAGGNRTIGFLAEYDALPGIGHACGHNLIGATSCTAAIALAKTLKNIGGSVAVVGCPAEEGGGGKVILAKRGTFRNLSVAMMAHPDSRTEPIKKMLALVELDIEFFGKESHAAAAPERGINALDAAAVTYQNILHYRKRIAKDARIHGIFTAAGTKPNIIPEYAALKYYVRALHMSYVERMIFRIKSIARREAKRIGAKTKFKMNPLSYESFYPNRTLGKIFAKQLAFLRIKNEQGSETKGIGSSDVGNVGQRVPTIHPSIKICDHLSVHTRAFAKAALSGRGYKAMAGAAKALALTGYEVLSNPQSLKRITAEFKTMRT